MRAIFNSLGSNYDFKFAMTALFFCGKNGSEKLKTILLEKYGKEAVLTYKGRHALELVLKSLNLPENSGIAVNGFTCFSVYKSIINCGLNPVYLDIKKNGLNFSAETLSEKLSKENIKAVIVQNTLGYPCDIKGISKICKDNKLALIEDLAHCIGTRYDDGSEAGTLGDFVTFSFSQDKVVDAISGGAAIAKQGKIETDFVKDRNLCQQLKDRFYPLFTWKIRRLYPIGFGKALHQILKSLNFLPKPVIDNNDKSVFSLPEWQASLVGTGFINLNKQLAHRREIAKFYAKNIDSSLLLMETAPSIGNSVNLRFPIAIKNRQKLVSRLKRENFFLADIWYDAPIAPQKYLHKTNYKQGLCPNSEAISELILNLPTHQNVTLSDAGRIVEIVNNFEKEHNVI